jgi:hypothetical protein
MLISDSEANTILKERIFFFGIHKFITPMHASEQSFRAIEWDDSVGCFKVMDC